jgi:UPF0271 protein
MQRVDLNCDLGEGAGHDAELMPLITSASVACGGHAGDEASMRATVELARQHHVAIGAHPGFNDREHFGRRALPVTPAEVYDLVAAQVWALQRIAREAGVRLAHVKPHGALYNLAAREAALAGAVAGAVHEADPHLILVGLAGSRLLAAGRARGLRVASEVFADRTYQADGSLTPRTQSDAFVREGEAAAARVVTMVREGYVWTADGGSLKIRADTVCLHGDGPEAVAFARRLNHALREAGIELQSLR